MYNFVDFQKTLLAKMCSIFDDSDLTSHTRYHEILSGTSLGCETLLNSSWLTMKSHNRNHAIKDSFLVNWRCFISWNVTLWNHVPQPVKMNLIKKSLPTQKTIQTFKVDTQGFRITTVHNPQQAEAIFDKDSCPRNKN